MNKINKIFIADLGLNKINKNLISTLNEKIEIINTNLDIGHSKKIYSKNWIDAVSQKTAILSMLIQNEHTPIVMLDSDILVVEDFADVIDLNYDVQICKRTIPNIRPDGFILTHIASFVVVNNINGKIFIDAWINRLKERINLNMIPPYETPAMIETMISNMELKIGDLDDKIVSCDNNYYKDITKIIHAKGRRGKDPISIFRFANVRRLPYRKIIYILNGNNDFLLFTIVFIFKKVFRFFEMPFIIIKQKIKWILKTN